MEIIIKDLEHIGEAAQQFVEHFGLDKPAKQDVRCFAFYGKMGAGKTTFVKALCEQLGVEDAVTSPTFAIVNEYEAANSCPIYHFDFYRIKKLSEAYDIGCDEYFYSGHPCFIEWPELIEELLPEETINVSIEELADGKRKITV